MNTIGTAKSGNPKKVAAMEKKMGIKEGTPEEEAMETPAAEIAEDKDLNVGKKKKKKKK